MSKVVKSFQYGEHTCTLETGRVGRQANGAVMVSMGDTVVLVTAVGKKNAEEGRDFFPLTVDYREKSYAVGKVPGGYFKREGRPTEKETLTSRLIDRPIRPLFPKGFTNEVQVIATLMSLDPHVSADVLAIIGAAAALAISGMPFNGPLAAARVGYREGRYLLNPSRAQLDHSQLDLMVAGTEKAVLMVESEADQLSEAVMLGAVLFGHEQMQVVIQAIQAFAEEVGVAPWEWQAPEKNTALAMQLRSASEAALREAYQIREKQARVEQINTLRDSVVEKLVNGADAGAGTGTSISAEQASEATPPLSAEQVGNEFHDLEKEIVRGQILAGEPRIDGRSTEDIRDISTEVGVLPRTHGSSLFTRGETQALVVCTLGTERDAQLIDDLEGEYRENFMLHYNFPPYCVGEVGFMSGPKRREIGHGKLAKRALEAIIPSIDSFPYVLRLVSEITESNGSSSMASVCGSSMALMDAGVPIKGAVAGIAMGLIKEGNKYAILSDILGDEDHLGDMDFKVAGTEQGVTALQMDIKIDGITKEIMENALEQAKRGRLYILNKMLESIQAPRQDISQHAPRITTIKINADKIRDVIGKGGATIRELTEATNCTIDIADDGVVKVAAVNGEDAKEAVRRIQALTAEVEVGKVYDGKVVKIVDFGAFVEVLPGRQGLVHISQIAKERVENVRDYLQEDQMIRVKVVDIDRQGRVRLTMKEVDTI